MKIISIIVCISFFMASCATIALPKAPISPVIDESKLIEAPIEKREEKNIPKGSFGKKVLLKGDLAVGDGVLLDESEITRLALIKTERDRLRSDLLTERVLKIKVDYLHERALWESEVKYLQSQPSWWEKHDGKIGLFVGVLIGSFVAIGVAAGIGHVAK